jgi:hypothetical protein
MVPLAGKEWHNDRVSREGENRMNRLKWIGCATVILALVAPASAQGSDTISNSAAVYGTYQTDVSNVNSKPLASAAEIDAALNTLGGHNADQLSKGWVSYMAMIAAQDPAFRKSLKDVEAYYGRDALVGGLRNDPRYARTMKGADTAVSAALTASAADNRRLQSASAFVKEQSYSLQGTGWAKAKIGNSKAKASSLNSTQAGGIPAKSGMISAFSAYDIDSTLAQAGLSSSASIWDNISATASSVKVPSAVSSAFADRKRVKYGKEPVADRIAAVAAYRVLGSSNSPDASSVMAERDTKTCMNMANLNLQQCVAAANAQYELPLCIGTHAIGDVATCTSVYQ